MRRALAAMVIMTLTVTTVRAGSEGEMIPPAGMLGHDHVKHAISLVTHGKVYSLAVVTGPDTPAYPGRHFSLHVMPVFANDQSEFGQNRLTGHDDMICTYLGMGTQIDGLGHVGVAGEHFGGVRAADFWRPTGLKQFGVETIKPIVTRGVLIDVAALHGKPLHSKQGVGETDIRAAMKRQGISLAKGDVVLLHTGWQAMAEQDPDKFLASEPGLTMDGAAYLAAIGAVAVGADNWGLEVIPPQDANQAFPVHQFLLARKGIYIVENIQTLELSSDQVYEFLFILAAPRLAGAVQGIVHPVAIR